MIHHASADSLPAFTEATVCTKCLGADVGFRHCGGGEDQRCTHVWKYADAFEHMVRDCKRCGYAWLETVAITEDHTP